MARSGARRQARSRRHARLPHVDELSLFRRRAADRDLVREERPQHLRHASLHPSAVDGGGPGLGIAQRLGDLQDHRTSGSRSLQSVISASSATWCSRRSARHAGRARATLRGQGLEEGRMRTHPRRHRAADRRGRARLSQHLPPLHRAWAACRQARQRRQGHRLGHRGRGQGAGRPQLSR